MKGYSGRHHGAKFRTTESCIALDLANLGSPPCERLMLMPSTGLRVWIRPTSPDELEVRVGAYPSYKIALARTPLNFGGERLWLTCPGCRSRRRVLYVNPQSHALGCRVCLRLRYSVQRMSQYWRLNRKLDQVWQQLGGEPDGYARRYWPKRPKWRRKATQYRLREEWERVNADTWAVGMSGFARLMAKWDR